VRAYSAGRYGPAIGKEAKPDTRKLSRIFYWLILGEENDEIHVGASQKLVSYLK
jgi:hypothetical protein